MESLLAIERSTVRATTAISANCSSYPLNPNKSCTIEKLASIHTSLDSKSI